MFLSMPSELRSKHSSSSSRLYALLAQNVVAALGPTPSANASASVTYLVTFLL